MNSIFLRIYGGMCAAPALVALLGVLALHLLNEVRGEQYRERLAHGTFSLMADNLQPMADIERRRAWWCGSACWVSRCPCSRSVPPVSISGSGPGFCVARHMVVQSGPYAARVYRLISEQEQLLLAGMSSRSASNWHGPPSTCWPMSWCAIRWPSSRPAWQP